MSPKCFVPFSPKHLTKSMRIVLDRKILSDLLKDMFVSPWWICKTTFWDMTPKIMPNTYLTRYHPQHSFKQIPQRIDNITWSKTISQFLILFVRCFAEKARTLWGHISQTSSSGIFWAGWLVGYSSQKCPKHIFRHYPSVILLQISLANSPCQNFLVDISYFSTQQQRLWGLRPE